MYTDAEIAALKTSVQVQTSIDNTATPTGTQPYVSPNDAVATDLNLGQGASFNLWLTKALRKLYNKTRI